MKKRFSSFCLAVVFLFITTSVILSYSKHGGTDSRVSALLILSMKARDAGKMDRALLFWQQAKSIRQGISMPKWLSEPLLKEQEIELSDKQAISIIASLPYKLAKPIMEGILAKNPSRNGVRKLFVDKARLASDVQQVKRNESITSPKVMKRPKGSIWKVIFLIAIIMLAIWQIYLIVFDSHRKVVDLENKIDE